MTDGSARGCVTVPGVHVMASGHILAGRRGTIPDFHSYPPTTAAHRGALDGGRTSGFSHAAITSVAALTPDIRT
jgi:hypothetical protein